MDGHARDRDIPQEDGDKLDASQSMTRQLSVQSLTSRPAQISLYLGRSILNASSNP
jgi:hypothetical protein